MRITVKKRTTRRTEPGDLAMEDHMVRSPGWAAAALIAAALMLTACGKANPYSGGSGGAYASPTTSSSSQSAGPAYGYGSSGTSAGHAALKTELTRAGTILASPGGLTLYYYSEDKAGSGRSMCAGGCAAAWPPLAAPVRVPAGVHLPGPLGVITRSDGSKQVTINGYPIYRYADDTKPGQAAGNGEEGVWHVIKIHGTTARTLKVTRTSAGKVLASPGGLTLYYYSEDKAGSGRSMCAGGCAAAWPPLAAPVRVPAGVHLPGPLGVITRSDGSKQVTINGYPIYRYAEDTKPGQAAGNGEEGVWHVIKIKAS
jgi:predicted lipoprotein with Yx(FWY)xxD motif